MSSAADLDEVTTVENVCANCAIAGVDINLEECNDCDLVKYCSDNCREEHREQHGKECKNRKVELRNRKLFTQEPDESHLGECPLCFLPLPIDRGKSLFYSCCSKSICIGCVHANQKREAEEGLQHRCPFCREPTVNREENSKRVMKRVKANDPAAMLFVGTKRYHERDYEGAIEYWTKAAELGNFDAHYNIGALYRDGEGVEKDEEKAVYHWEKAAIGGHPEARHSLARIDERYGNFERAVEHFIIAANIGFEISMKALWKYYSAGYITKDDLEATLRTHKAAIDEMKSKERDAADAFLRQYAASR